VNSLSLAFEQALALIAHADAELLHIVGLSLSVSLTATAIASFIGLLFGAAIGVMRFPGRRVVLVILNAFMGLPPVVVGLVIYL
jgi:tungstate transport system permease protein